MFRKLFSRFRLIPQPQAASPPLRVQDMSWRSSIALFAGTIVIA